MCGICGIADWRGGEIDRDLLARMRDVMLCRGPDDAGLYVAPCIGLGHRRLSIIDLSPAGHQPMCNEDQSVWVVFNGEIYNFLELRPELEKAGHRFRSSSDTEVLIHGFEQWGIEALTKRIRGMFAFAIWDSRNRRLHLGRDHLGKKPLFYWEHNGRFCFASDIKAIWIASGQSLAIDEQGLDQFLYQYYILQDHTIYRGVHKLLPAHIATVGPDGAVVSRYWAPDYSRKEQKSEAEWLEGVDYHLRRAVKRRLISDVPLGAFLSGGVDSSCVCALMAQEGTGKLKTFSVAMNEDVEKFDESEYSRAVAEHIGSEHTELVAQANAAPLLSDIVWQYGEPYGDSSMIPTYLIAQAARKHVTVVLTGDGGDEGFAGYDRYVSAGRGQRYSWLPGFLRKGLFPWVGGLIGDAALGSLTAQRVRLFTQMLAEDPKVHCTRWCWWYGLRRPLYAEALRKTMQRGPSPFEQAQLDALTGRTAVDRSLEHCLLVDLPGDYLTKVDVATMANSLEARSPFMDVDLLEFAISIPVDVLMKDGQPKALLKRYAERLIPRKVIYRPKMGFSIPMHRWLSGAWSKPVQELLLSKPAMERGYFRPEMVRKVLGEHMAGKVNHDHRIWTLLVFEIWNRLFVDRTLKPGDPVFG